MRFIRQENIYGAKKQLLYQSIRSGVCLILLYFTIYWVASFLIDAHVPKEINFVLNHRIKDVVVVFDIILCFLIYMALILQFIRKKHNNIIYLIDHIHLMKNEVFSDPISISGNDEISHLALHLDQFRLQLAKNKNEGERKARKQTDLLTSISHDLRTPLTSLMGYLEILSEYDFHKNEDVKGYIDLCLKRAQQLQYLVNTTFEHFYLTDKEQEKIELLRCNAIKSLLKILSDRAQLLKQNGFAYEMTLPDYHYSIVYDTRLMERLFDNIFTNIIRYGLHTAEVKITVSVEAKGLGIEIVNFIDKKRKSNEGTGIGIRNCYQIMKLHKGYFDTFMDGSKFTTVVILPINNHALH